MCHLTGLRAHGHTDDYTLAMEMGVQLIVRILWLGEQSDVLLHPPWTHIKTTDLSMVTLIWCTQSNVLRQFAMHSPV